MALFFLATFYQYLENQRWIKFKILAARSKAPSIELAAFRRYMEHRRNEFTILPSIKTSLFSPRRLAAPAKMVVVVPLGGYLLMFIVVVVVPFGVLANPNTIATSTPTATATATIRRYPPKRTVTAIFTGAAGLRGEKKGVSIEGRIVNPFRRFSM